jgi:uncharacterized protein
MKKHQIYRFIALSLMLLVCMGCSKTRHQDGDYPIKPKPFTTVEVKDNFWATRIRTNHEVTIPVSIHQSIITGRIRNFEIAGGLFEGDFQSDYPFDDSDVFKIIEGASYSLAMFPDPELEQMIDSLIWIIGQAQEDNGYLYTWRTIHGDDSHPWIGSRRWERTHVMSHELYNVGHMYEAAVAHYQLTGRRDFLDIAIKNADLVLAEIGPGKFETYPGHQEIEIGLAKLYRATGNKAYLDQAKYFLDARGRDDIGEPPFWHEGPRLYDQAHIPVTEQTEAVGHSVRALYMYSGMADVAALTGNKDYIRAIDRLWEDVTYTKTYLTGGIGAQGGHEGFGDPYELPNLTAYAETCAGIANVLWNHRLFLLHGDARYIDVLERSLYNNVLSGVAVTGDRFFYPNPLESHGQHKRSEWFGCACCPSNLNRFIPSVPGYIYAQQDHNLYVNLFISSETSFDMNGTGVHIEQSTGMPWEGDVRIAVNPERKEKFSLRVRIPGWAENSPIPGDLYRFLNTAVDEVVVTLNGKQVQPKREKGFAVIDRTWQAGDLVEVRLPMDIRRVVSDDRVEANRGLVALQRGPVVFAAEWPDYEDESVLDIILDDSASLSAEFDKELLGGQMLIRGMAKGSERTTNGEISLFDKPFTAIPYYAWAHRGQGQMLVWFAGNADSARPKPAKTLAAQSSVEASHVTNALRAITNQILPAHSNDRNAAYYHWWPRMDQSEYLVYRWDSPVTVSRSEVYWFDDGPSGGCRIPAEWKILYSIGNEWIPVENLAPYEIHKDRLNEVHFRPVTTTALKLEVILPAEYSSGIYEWAVYPPNL